MLTLPLLINNRMTSTAGLSLTVFGRLLHGREGLQQSGRIFDKLGRPNAAPLPDNRKETR
jgi:hypothetical protein